MGLRLLLCLAATWAAAVPPSFGEPARQPVVVADPEALAAAAREAKPGETILLADGTWHDAVLVVEGQGSADRPITIRAQTPGKVVLTDESRLHVGGRHLVIDGLYFHGGSLRKGSLVSFRVGSDRAAHHCRLTNTAFLACNPPETKIEYKWVSLYGTHNRVDHCLFREMNHTGQMVVVWVGTEPDEHRIDHNHFADRPPLGWNGGETIRIGTSDVSMNVSRTLVECNLFEACDGEVEIVSNKSCENLYRYNTFRRSAGALTLRHGNRCVVEGNWFFGEGKRGTGGVRIIGEDHHVIGNYFCDLAGDGARSAITLMNGRPDSPLNGYFQVKNAVVAFNTLVDCAASFTVGQGDPARETLPPVGCVVADNVVQSAKGPLVRALAPLDGVRWEGNVFSGSGTGVPGITPVDPRLRLADDGLWRPEAGSPLLGAATGTHALVATDIDGQPRGERRDVGCDQASDAPIVRRPLTAADVGPEWMRGRPAP